MFPLSIWYEPAYISIHVPRVGDDPKDIYGMCVGIAISIHVPRVGDDPVHRWASGLAYRISIHVPRVGDDGHRGTAAYQRLYFYPRPPRGGRRSRIRPAQPLAAISIHVPRVGDDPHIDHTQHHRDISIHVPRVGDDLSVILLLVGRN